MEQYSRRTFTGLVAASVSLTTSALQAASLPTRRLGAIDFQASILGIGAQYLGDPAMDPGMADRVVGEAIESGVNYIDTAPTYGVSEERLGRALKGKRDKVFLVSKVETLTSGDALYQVRDSLRKLQTDHLDCVLIHNISRTDRYPDLPLALSPAGALGGLLQAKKQGMIRHIGCTSHMRPARVLPVFETGQIELFMGVFNIVDRHVYAYEDKVLPEARKRNIGVIAMKVLGGPLKGPTPRLASPEDRQTSLRYAWGLEGLSVAIVGMRSPEELRQALAAARSFKPLDQAEMAAITERGKQLAAQWGPVRGPVA